MTLLALVLSSLWLLPSPAVGQHLCSVLSLCKFQLCPHFAAPFPISVEDLPIFPLALQSLLLEALSLCRAAATFLELCSTSPPLPYSRLSNPHFTYCFNCIIRLKNPFLGSPVKLHQVQACLSCSKTCH